MAIKYEKKKQKQNTIVFTVITAVLILAIFTATVAHFYMRAEDEAYEMLHIQTKQIKDDLTLQLKSDRENLVTMANFAAGLYADNKGYDRLFNSFEPIGLFSRIGILTPDNQFISKEETYDLNGRLSFDEEAKKGEHISGRVASLTLDGREVVRSSVPIRVDNKPVGILYGVMYLDTLGSKYNNMAKELDAQLFVYDKETGKFIIDTIDNPPGELSQLKNREYRDGYSYQDLVSNDKGFSSFKSIRTGENLYIHYSTLEDFNWGIMLARYESQVFAKTHAIFRLLSVSFIAMLLVTILYLFFITNREKNNTKETTCASKIRKLLLEINQHEGNILESLKNIQNYAQARSAFFLDSDQQLFRYTSPTQEAMILHGNEKNYLISELFHYASELYATNRTPISTMRIIPDKHLFKTNRAFYDFMNKHKIYEVSFAAAVGKNNHISLLGVVNPKNSRNALHLIDDIAVCFSIAIYNKKHLNRTETAATTDALTGAFNRVAYKNDLLRYDTEMPKQFTCIYIDVNELHLHNNKYGHAAGDEMLVYIANTLKESFYGHPLYRMGGDEFLIFLQDVDPDHVKASVDSFLQQLEPTGYHVAIGTSFRKQNTNTEEMVKEAEIRMYEAKARYYQNKEEHRKAASSDRAYVQTQTGIAEIDTMLSILNEHYFGIYRVSLDTNYAHRILMPAYLGYQEDENDFSALLTRYISDCVNPDDHRALMSFMNYDAIKSHLLNDNIPRMTYRKVNGESVILSVYKLKDSDNPVDTLWVFAKD